MEVQIDPELLRLVESQSENLITAIHEALKLWLEQKLTTCPITKGVCSNNQILCSDCPTFSETS
ncbi:MAG: hypothetical protein P8X91_03185 [Candidatus Bathyarchaeota archaeon]|jgi:hypothetical protein